MMRCLCGMVTLKPLTGSVSQVFMKSRSMRRRDKERQIHRVHAPRLKAAIVHCGRDRMLYGIGDDAVDLRRARDLLGAVHVP
jgi:hypothetical protein